MRSKTLSLCVMLHEKHCPCAPRAIGRAGPLWLAASGSHCKDFPRTLTSGSSGLDSNQTVWASTSHQSRTLYVALWSPPNHRFGQGQFPSMAAGSDP